MIIIIIIIYHYLLFPSDEKWGCWGGCGCRDPAIRATPAFIALTAVVIINNIASSSSCCCCFVDNQFWHHHRFIFFACFFMDWLPILLSKTSHFMLFVITVNLLFRCEGQFNHQQYKSITSLFEKNILRYAENPFKVHSTNLKHFVLSAEAVTRWNRLALKKVITLGHFDYSHQAGGHRSVGASVRSISCMITVPVRPNPSSQL